MIESFYKLSAFSLSYHAGADKAEELLNRRKITPGTSLGFISPNNIKLCAVQLKYKHYKTFAAYLDEMEGFLQKAVKDGCHLVCFPEYTGLLLYTMIPRYRKMEREMLAALSEQDVAGAVQVMDEMLDHFSTLIYESYYRAFWLLAQKYNLYICAGSAFAATNEGVYSRAHLFGPGESFFQDKLHLAGFEQQLGLSPGETIEVFDTRLGRVAMIPGEDNLFFESYRAARDQGAQIVLAPTAGLEGVAYGCAHDAAWVRAQESRMYVLKAALVDEGSLPRPVRGTTGLYCPWYGSRNQDGVLAAWESHTAQGSVVGRADLEKLPDMLDMYRGESDPALWKALSERYTATVHP